MIQLLLLLACAGAQTSKPGDTADAPALIGSAPPPTDSSSSPTDTSSSFPTDTDTDTATQGTEETGDTGVEGEPRDPCDWTPRPVDVPSVQCPPGVAAVRRGQPHASVTAAVGEACDGDTIVVCPGEWPTTAFIGQDLELVGRDGAEATILRGVRNSVVRVSAVAHVTLRGLTLTGGRAPSGGGARIDGEADFVDCAIHHNAAVSGGGVSATGGTVTFSGCTIHDNEASDRGGGIDAQTVHIENSTVSQNHAPLGGGIRSNEILLVDSLVTNNEATSGGGIWSGAFDVDGSTFVGNVAQTGGAIWSALWTPDVGVLRNSVLVGNRATDGGGVYVSINRGCELTVSGTAFLYNRAVEHGGGLELRGTRAEASISNSVLMGNVARAGGGVYTSQHHTFQVYVSGVDFDSNAARAVGGAVYSKALLDISRGSIRRNAGQSAAGIWAGARVTTITDVRFGDGAVENEAGDLRDADETWDLDGTASASCVGGVCTVAP